MSKDLLARIQELNRRNHQHTHGEPATTATAVRTPPDVPALLANIESQLVDEVRRRVDRVLARFTGELEGIASSGTLTPGWSSGSTYSGVGGQPESLEATQRIRGRDEEVAATRDHAAGATGHVRDGDGAVELATFLCTVDRKLDRAHETAAAIEKRLDEVEAVLVHRTTDSAQSPIVSRIEGLESSLAPVFDKLRAEATAGSRDNDTGELVARIEALERSLGDRLRGAFEETFGRVAHDLEALGVARTPDEPRTALLEEVSTVCQSFGSRLEQTIGEAVATITKRMETVESRGSPTASDAPTAMARLEELERATAARFAEQGRTAETFCEVRLAAVEERLRELIRRSETAPGAERFAAIEAALARLPAELGDIVAQHATPIAAAPAGAHDSAETAGAASPNSAEVVTLVKGLRKEFSLLVHTLNNHLEENTRARGGEGAVAGGADPGLADALRTAIAELEKLRALPETIKTLLTATDEANQFSISAAVQESTDAIVSRMEELLAGLK